MPALEIIDLVKRYPGVVAVDGITLTIERGICFGLLGPNGAGKTSTIEIVEGIRSPTSGTVLYNGKPRSSSFREKIGIQFQSTSLLAHLTVRESIETFGRFYRHPLPVDEIVRLCHLSEIVGRNNDKISGGQKQRLMLAIALINDPDLVFLDEPTTGLDPQARRHLWDIVEGIKAAGKTVILTTHYMEEAQVLCDQIAIVDKGRIIARGSPGDLLQEHGRGSTILLPGPLPEGVIAMLTAAGAVSTCQGEGTRIHTREVNTVLRLLLEQGVDLSGADVQTFNLEDLFLQLTGRRLRS